MKPIFKDMLDRVASNPASDTDIDERLREEAERTERYRRGAIWDELVLERGSRYADCRFGTYVCNGHEQAKARQQVEDYARSLPAALEFGRGMVLFGPRGTGKDHLLMSVLRAAVKAYGFTVKWQNGQDLFGQIRDGMDSGESEGQLVARLSQPQILAISDPLPIVGELTAHQSNMLFRIVDRRYSRNVPTLVTLNVLTGAEAEKRMGAQIVDRLKHDALVVFCSWPSFRKAAD